MNWAISPYDLTARTPTAFAALLLAERCITLFPSPASSPTREAFDHAARAVPGFRDLVETWAWTTPLWDDGLIAASVGGHQVPEQVRSVLAVVESDPALAALRNLVSWKLLADEDAFLEVLAIDLLRGGVDPGVTVPLAVGLDLFAARHALVVARSAPKSVVERAEQRDAQPVSVCVIPLVVQAHADRVIEARSLLAQELDDLRAALVTGTGVKEASHAYTRAFELEREQLLRCDDPDDPPAMEVQAAVSVVELPGDASLRASAAAAEKYMASNGERAPTTTVADAPIVETLPPIRTALIKPIGRPVALR